MNPEDPFSIEVRLVRQILVDDALPGLIDFEHHVQIWMLTKLLACD